MGMKEGMLHFRLFSPLLRFFVLFCFLLLLFRFLFLLIWGKGGIRVPFTFPFCATSISVLERIRFKLYCTHFELVY